MGDSARPQVLTVLCILSFIGSGLGVLGGILGLVGSSMLAGLPGMQAPGTGGMAMTAVSLVLSAASFFGVWQMWNLKKQGFMIYSVANLAALVVSFVTIMSMGMGLAVGAMVERGAMS